MVSKCKWLIGLFFFISCADQQRQAPAAAGPPPPVWAQYKVWAAEGDSLVTAMFQFYTDPALRRTLVLEEPAGVQMDGQKLAVDSAGISGAYYEWQAPVDRFAGRHFVRFTHTDGRQFTDTFAFRPFTLTAGLPESVSARDYELQLEGLPDGSLVRVVLTDTSLAGKGINELESVQEGRVRLPARYFEALYNGPVILHLTYEQEKALRSRLPGEILLSYSLMRVLELQK